MSEYRVIERQGWFVEIREGVAVTLGETLISRPGWEIAAGPFATRKEAESEMARLRSELAS